MASVDAEPSISSPSESPTVENSVEGCRSSPKYVYQPLAQDQIRIVHLFQVPETPYERLYEIEKGLYCVIRHADASHANYTALSYEWGDSNQLFTISVHDEQGTPLGNVGLTLNLRNALADLVQAEIEPKTFWIDQLCIDQGDDQDKARQVPLMGSIYRNASQVLTYLGPAEPTDGEALELIDTICQHYLPMLKQMKDSQEITAKSISALSNLLRESPALEFHVDAQKPVLAGLYRLIEGGWLRRRWMIQENALNRKTSFLRGQQKLEHTDGILILFLIQGNILPAPPYDKDWGCAIVNSGYTVSGLEFCKARAMKLRYLLLLFSQTQCQDPRDRIFSLLSMAADAPRLDITVDYRRTESQVLVDTATRMLENYQDLAILAYAPRRTSIPGYLPSWVPYWDIRDDTYPSSIKHINILRAAGESRVQHAFVDDGQTLILKGLILGNLQSCLGVWGSHFIDNAFDLPFRDMVEDTRQKLGVLGNIRQQLGRSEQSDLTLACTLGALTKRSLPGDFSTADTIVYAFHSALNLLQRSLEVRDTPSHGNDDFPVVTSMTEDEVRTGWKFIRDIHISNRSFWIMNDKFLCLAPDTAKRDDLVVVLFGGRVLYILRPATEEDRYHFIGTAYVQDFMEGEAMQDPEWEQNVKSFSLV